MEQSELPYVENFDSVSEGLVSTVLPCWSQLVVNDSTTLFPRVVTARGSKCIAFRPGERYGVQYVVLPQLDSVGGLTLAFDATRNSMQNYIEVGVMTDPSNPNSFTLLETLGTAAGLTSLEWRRFEVAAPSGTTATYFAIRVRTSIGTLDSLYIDNVELFVSPSCPAPLDIAVDSIAYNSARLTVWDPANVNDYTVTLNGSSAVYNSRVITLVGLTENTAYSLSVVANCDNGVPTAALSASFATPFAPVDALPYETGFESGEDTNWNIVNGPNGWVIGGDTSSTGSNALYIGGSQGYGYNIGQRSASYAYRGFALPQGGEYVLEFDWTAQGENGAGGAVDYMRVWLAPTDYRFYPNYLPTSGNGYTEIDNYNAIYNYNAFIPQGWIPIGTAFNLNTDGMWRHERFSFELDTAREYNLVFLWLNDNYGGIQPPAAIDNVKLRLTTCKVPAALAFDEVLPTTLAFSWQGYGNETEYEVTFDGTAHTTPNAYDQIENLAVASSHTLAIRAVCGAGDTSAAIALNVKTDCMPTPLPYQQDFDAVGTVDSIPCWTMLGYTANGTRWPSLSSMTAHDSSPRSLYVLGASPSQPAVALLPTFAESVDSLLLTLWGNVGNAANIIEVGVVPDRFNMASFEVVDTLRFMQPDVWTRFELPLNTYTGMGGNIALRVPNAIKTFIDDIEVRLIPDCVQPNSVAVSNVSSTSADITVADVAWNNHYRLYWNGDSTDIYSDTYTLYDLTPGTFYSLEVATICLDSTLTPRVSATFITECEPVTHNDLPYTEGFDAYLPGPFGNPCWTVNNYYPSSQPSISTVRQTSGSNSIRLYPGDNSQPQFLVLPEFDDVTDLMVSFNAYGPASARLDVGVMTDPEDTLTFIPVGGLSALGGGEWIAHEVYFNALSLPMASYIAFRGGVNSLSGWEIFIDDIRVDVAPPCLPLAGMELDSVADSSVVVRVDDPSTTLTYRWSVVDIFGDTLRVATAHDTVFTVDALEPLMIYTLTVASICSDSSHTTPLSLTFGTTCSPIAREELPLVEDFEAYGTDQYVTCWNRLNYFTTYGDFPVASGNRGQGGSQRSLQFFPGGRSQAQYAVMAPVGNLDSLYLSFWSFRGNSAVRLDVGLMTDPTDSATFTTLQTMEPTPNEWELEVLRIGNAGGARYVAFRAYCATGSAYSFFIDNITLDTTFTCPQPLAVRADGVGEDSARIIITATPEATAYRLLYGSTGLTDTLLTADTVVTLTALQPATQYTVSVEALCPAGMESDAVQTAFTTLAPPEPPCCLPPTDIVVSVVTNTTATVSWNDGCGSSQGWVLDCNGTEVAPMANPYTLTGLTPGTAYTVRMRADCTDSLSAWSDPVSFTTENVGIAGVDRTEVTLRPNPATTEVTLFGLEAGTRVSVADLNGRTVLEAGSRGATLTLDLSRLPRGAYFVRIVSGKTTAVRKLIVK